MDSKQFHRRTWVLVGILILVILVMASQLYQTQVVDGEGYLTQAVANRISYETVDAARGDIVDRYGRILVTNTTTYQVTLDTSAMDGEENWVVETLLDICRSQDVDWSDSLPISASAPYTFTTDDPYYTVGQDVLGRDVRYLTRLGKLALKLGWLEVDPTSKEGADALLPTAQELLVAICQGYGLLDEGETALTIPLRQMAGVRYDMSLRDEEIIWTEYIFAQDVDIKFISLVKEKNLDGVEIDAVADRVYYTDYAAHLLGRVGLMSDTEWAYYKTVDGYEMDDTVGKEGVELAFEDYLRGTDGTLAVEYNSTGEVVSESWVTAPVEGNNVVLTLDIDLQKKVEDTMAEMIPLLKSEGVEGGACVVLDVNSGEVLSMASYPTYYLATYSQDYADNIANPLTPLYNRASQGLYAPGSTFKMVTAIAALEEGIVEPSTQIYDYGVYRYYVDNGPQCWLYAQYGSTHGYENVSDAIKDSCNYYFYEVGRLLGIDRLVEYAELFGLGEKTGFELTESEGIIAGPEYNATLGLPWYDGSTLSAAIGQESNQFTPLQLANYIATLVNGGTRYSTTLLSQVKSGDYSQIMYTQYPEVLSSIDIEDENLEAVKQGMLALTQSGSVSTYFTDLDVEVGAKTGSAQVFGSGEETVNGLFVCFAPYDDPEIAIAIAVERVSGGTDIGAIAAEIIEYYFASQEERDQMPSENSLVR